MGKLSGKVAVVTGASSGIGAETAREFARQGAKVVLAARSEDKLEAVRKEITDIGSEAVVVIADVSKEEDNKKIVETAVNKFGGLHSAFINAGVGNQASIFDVEEDAIDKIIDVNFKGVVFGLKYQLPAISKAGGGSITVISSALGERVAVNMPDISIYAASKAAANMMVKYGAVQGAPMGVRVNGIAPGLVRTPMNDDMGDEAREEWARQIHLDGKLNEPSDMARFAAYLASDDAHVMTGGIHPVDGGCSLKM